MILPLHLCYSFITYETKTKLTLTFITAPAPCLIFNFVTLGAKHFRCEKLWKEYYFSLS